MDDSERLERHKKNFNRLRSFVERINEERADRKITAEEHGRKFHRAADMLAWIVADIEDPAAPLPQGKGDPSYGDLISIEDRPEIWEDLVVGYFHRRWGCERE